MGSIFQSVYFDDVKGPSGLDSPGKVGWGYTLLDIYKAFNFVPFTFNQMKYHKTLKNKFKSLHARTDVKDWALKLCYALFEMNV